MDGYHEDPSLVVMHSQDQVRVPMRSVLGEVLVPCKTVTLPPDSSNIRRSSLSWVAGTVLAANARESGLAWYPLRLT